MTLPRARLALPLLACTLLLTACPGGPPVVDVPSSPAVLHGVWQGDLTSSIGLREATLGGGRVYLLHTEAVPLPPSPAASPLPARVSQTLLVLDAASGAEQARVPLEGVDALRFRPAEGDRPARLLVLLGPRTVPGTSTVSEPALSELDPVTLAERRTTPLPRGEGGYRFSADGRWLLFNPVEQLPLDTRTLQPAALPAAVREQLRLPQTPDTRFMHWDFGARFLRVVTRASTAQNTPWTARFFSADSGNVFGSPALHPATCAHLSTAQLDSPADLVDLPEGGAALAYQDGTVEVRDAGDHLRVLVNLGGCQPLVLRADGDVLTFADPSRGELGTLRVRDGAILGRRTTTTINAAFPPQLVAEGTALVPRSQPGTAPLVALERVSGTGWHLDGQVHTLRLDTRATWVSKTEYTSVGTAVLDGERLNFTARANSGGYELRPQGTPILPVTWRGELRREDGHLVARVSGSHADRTPYQGVGLELQDQERDFAFSGSLKR